MSSGEEEIIEEDILDSKSESISDDLPLYYSNTENNPLELDLDLSKNLDEDKLFNVDTELNEIAKHFQEPEASNSGVTRTDDKNKKEISPLSDDVILINDKKVSIHSLDSAVKPKKELSFDMDSIEDVKFDVDDDDIENDFSIDELEICSTSLEKPERDTEEISRKPLKSLYDQTKMGMENFHIEQKDKNRSIEALNLHSVDVNNWLHFKSVYKKNPPKDYTSLATTASTEYRTLQNEDYRLIEKDLMEKLLATEEENKQLKTLTEELTRKLATDETDQKSPVPISSVKKDSIERVIHDFTEMLTPEEKENYSSTLLKLKNYFDTRVCAADNEEIVNEKIQALEAKHCKEMEDLRKYFEKRCVDIEKQYSDEVFSMRSSRKSDMLPSSDDESDELKNDDALENNESRVSDSKPEPEIDESQQAKINWARELVLRELESQIQNLLFDNNCEQYEWPQELIILRDQFTARCQQEVATIQKAHEQELAKLKQDSELELKKLIEERENIKDISTTLRLTLEEVMKMISVNNLTTEDSLNISSLKDQKINLFLENSLEHETTSMRDNDKSEFNVSISKVDVEECLYRLRIEAANILDLSKRYFKQNDVDQLYMHPDPIADEILFDNILRKSKSFPSVFVDRFGRNEKRGILMDVENLKLFEEKSTSANLLPQINFEIPNETFVEGFGKCSPVHLKKKSLLMDLKSKTKNLLTSLYNENIENSMDHQFLRKFNEEIDAILEFEKMEKEDLQLQIDAADKQLKSTRAFLEQQAAEREQERDEFNKEIEYLKNILKEKDKDKLIHQKLLKENEYLQQNVKEIAKKNEELEEQSSQLEKDLKASVEKICVLREIIAELETQVAEKDALNDTIENTADITESTESFAQEVVQKNANDGDADGDLVKKVAKLEDHIDTLNVEHHEILSKINSQLMSIECAIDRKIEALEACNTIYSTTCMSPTEDISARAANRTETEDNFSYIEQLQRIFEKLSKHSCIEEATLKRIADLEMHVERSKMIINEMQQEKEITQEKVTEQDMKIASLQMRLDETRMRAEKVNNSELIIKIQDLQNEIKQLTEQLEFRDRQISSMNSMLETSKQLISDQDKQLVAGIETERILKEELLEARTELAQMEEKIKNEMVSRARISDLLDSLIGEKNVEMDVLEEKLRSRDKEIAYLRNVVESKISHESNLLLAKTYDEPDVLRDVADDNHKEPPYSLNFPSKIPNNENFTMLEKSRSLGSVAQNFQTSQTFNFMNPSISSIPEISNVALLGKSDDRLSIDANNQELMHEKQLLEQELVELRELKAQNEIAEINRIREKTKELELQLECKDKDIDNLKSLLVTKDEHLQSLSTEIAQTKHLHDTQIELVDEIETLKHQILELTERISEKDHHIEHLAAQNKLNKIDSNEIENLRRELSLKSFALEKCKYDLQDYETQIVQLKERFVKSEQKMVEPITVDEITEKLEKELNYSAELDYNLMKAFESDPLGGRKELRLEKNFKEKYEEVLQDLESERKYFKYMHMHDISLLESVKMRLNTAMESENVLKKLLDAEQQKNENLVAQLNKVNIDLLNAHPNSLKYLESEVILRLNNEIDYLKNRNTSEQNRILELQKIIENESQRFSRAFAELNDYCDTLKKSIKKLKHEKESLEMEIYRGNQTVLSPTEKFQLQELNEVENKRNIVIMHELEDRLHHLLIKYLRSESYRKALVYQKRYLMVISTKVTSKSHRKRKSFKVVVFAVIAIWRMKYIAKRWTNKKMSGKLICMTPTMPKRSQSTSTNKWATIPHHTNRC